MINIYEKLREALNNEINKHGLLGSKVVVRCKALSAYEAIGKSKYDDYPIIKGREVLLEADFNGAKGQAFTDEVENKDYLIDDILKISLKSNKERASFIASLNAVFNFLKLCDKTIHCKDNEPEECAKKLPEIIKKGSKVLLVGFQPRFLNILASNYDTRALDLDKDNIGKKVSGVIIEHPDKTSDEIKWCDLIFATGSTIVNGTISDFLNKDKPLILYGITVSAAAVILGLKRYCNVRNS